MSTLGKNGVIVVLIGFLHFRLPKIHARKITTLENPPKAQNFFPTKTSATGHE